MVPAPRQGVRRFALLLSALFLFPAATLGQPWLDAYETGNYTRAADLLHELVADPDALTTVSPIIPQTLADMYARGAGVQPDPIMACTLAEFAQGRALS